MVELFSESEFDDDVGDIIVEEEEEGVLEVLVSVMMVLEVVDGAEKLLSAPFPILMRFPIVGTREFYKRYRKNE